MSNAQWLLPPPPASRQPGVHGLGQSGFPVEAGLLQPTRAASLLRNGIMNFREEVDLFRACPSLRQTLGGYLPEHNRLFHASSSELHQEAGCNLPELPRHL